MTIKLYDMHDSPHARKVRLLAAEIDVPLELIAIDPRTGETRRPEFLAKNPNGRVPTLEENGLILWESAAILKYLSGKRPELALAGRDEQHRALVDQWLYWWTGGAEAAVDMLAWECLIKPLVFKKPGNDASIVAECHSRLDRFLPVLDRQLESKDYVLGPLTIVDFAIGQRLDRAPTVLKFDLAPYSNILSWMERLRARPYWAAA